MPHKDVSRLQLCQSVDYAWLARILFIACLSLLKPTEHAQSVILVTANKALGSATAGVAFKHCLQIEKNEDDSNAFLHALQGMREYEGSTAALFSWFSCELMLDKAMIHEAGVV